MEVILEGMCSSSRKDDKAAVGEHLTSGCCLSHSCETVVLPVSVSLVGTSLKQLFCSLFEETQEVI